MVFDWDGTAVPDREADASRIRSLVETLCSRGFDVGIVSGTHVGNVDGQLMARPAGPGVLHLCLNRGSEVYVVGPDGKPALAVYEMQRQPDGSWRINGCWLTPAPDQNV